MDYFILKKGKKPSDKEILNPVRYLMKQYKLSIFKGMMAYTYLRRSKKFEDYKKLNIEHAELGLLVMTKLPSIKKTLENAGFIKD